MKCARPNCCMVALQCIHKRPMRHRLKSRRASIVDDGSCNNQFASSSSEKEDFDWPRLAASLYALRIYNTIRPIGEPLYLQFNEVPVLKRKKNTLDISLLLTLFSPFISMLNGQRIHKGHFWHIASFKAVHDMVDYV